MLSVINDFRHNFGRNRSIPRKVYPVYPTLKQKEIDIILDVWWPPTAGVGVNMVINLKRKILKIIISCAVLVLDYTVYDNIVYDI